MEWIPHLPLRGAHANLERRVTIAWRHNNPKAKRPKAIITASTRLVRILGWTKPMMLTCEFSSDGSAMRLAPYAGTAGREAAWTVSWKDGLATVTVPLPWVNCEATEAASADHTVDDRSLIIQIPDWAKNSTVAGGGRAGAANGEARSTAAPAVAATPAEPSEPQQATQAGVAPGTAPPASAPAQGSKPNKWTEERKAKLIAFWGTAATIREISGALNDLPGDFVPVEHIPSYAMAALRLPSRGIRPKPPAQVTMTTAPAAPPPPAPANDVVIEREPHHSPLAKLSDHDEAKNLWLGGWDARYIAEDLGISLSAVSTWISGWREEKRGATPGAARA